MSPYWWRGFRLAVKSVLLCVFCIAATLLTDGYHQKAYLFLSSGSALMAAVVSVRLVKIFEDERR